MMLNATQIADFHNKGVLLIKGLFDSNEVEKLSIWLKTLELKQPKYGEEAKYYEKSDITGNNYLSRVENIIGKHNSEISELLLKESAIECLTELLGDVPALFKDKINFKQPGSRADMMHQDQAAGWGKYADFFISMIIAVDDNRRDNAAVSFMKTGNYVKRLMSDEWIPLTEEDPANLDQDEYHMIELDQGDVVFFDSYVPHGSAANYSDRQRRNFFLTFNAASQGEHKQQYYMDKWKRYPPNVEENAREADTFLV